MSLMLKAPGEIRSQLVAVRDEVDRNKTSAGTTAVAAMLDLLMDLYAVELAAEADPQKTRDMQVALRQVRAIRLSIFDPDKRPDLF